MTPKLESSVVLAKDLKDQPSSSHILLVGAGRPNYYAIDTWVVADGDITFYLDEKPVYACRLKEGAWAVVARDAVDIVTEKQFSEGQHADQKAIEAFYETLDPEMWKEAQEMAKRGGGVDLNSLLAGHATHAPTGRPSDDGKPVPGQYL